MTEHLRNSCLAVLACIAAAAGATGCGGGNDGVPQHTARAAATGATTPSAPSLPLDDATQHPLHAGRWRTHAGFPLPVTFRIDAAGWVGAHRSDLSWQLRLGPAASDSGGYIEVDHSEQTPQRAIAALRRTAGLATGPARRSRLGSRFALRVDGRVRRDTSLDVLGGFKALRGERFSLYAVRVGSTTLLVDAGADRAHRRAFLPRARRVLRSLQFG